MIDFYGGGSQILPKEYFANEPIHNGVSAPPHTITCTQHAPLDMISETIHNGVFTYMYAHTNSNTHT